MHMENKVKVYGERQLVNRNIADRAVSSAYVGEMAISIEVRWVKLLGLNSGSKYMWSSQEPWKESGFVLIPILVIAGWTFFLG